MITDGFGRPVLNLRISVTQRCNLRCPYCHREGQEKRPRSTVTEMTTAEIVRLARIAVGLGISRIKLTGGEPLLRNDIQAIVKGIAHLKGVKDLSLTTNGTRLMSMAEGLRAAGLMRVNLSLPSLKPKVYKQLMCGNLSEALEGLEAAVKTGFNPVKINMLVLAGLNEQEINNMASFASENGALLQLIELEPINISRSYYEQYHKTLDDVEDTLRKQAIQVELRHYMQNRRIYHLPKGRVEVIRPTENTEFCAHCTRLRVTSDGKLKPCLMVNTNLVDILTPMRNEASDKMLEEIFIDTCRKREPFYKPQICAHIER